jgi:hypothetical protein
MMWFNCLIPLGSQVLKQNPEYLMNLADAQESVANQLNSILGGEFVDPKFFGQLPKIVSIFGQL